MKYESELLCIFGLLFHWKSMSQNSGGKYCESMVIRSPIRYDEAGYILDLNNRLVVLEEAYTYYSYKM